MRLKTNEELEDEFGSSSIIHAVMQGDKSMSIKANKKFLLTLYHIMVGYRQPSKRVTNKRVSLKYRFKDSPSEDVITYDVLCRMDKINVMSLSNAGWYARFINRCKITYAFR